MLMRLGNGEIIRNFSFIFILYHSSLFAAKRAFGPVRALIIMVAADDELWYSIN